MICVDATVAVKWVVAEDHSDLSLALYEACIEAGDTILAPALLPFEVTNALRQKVVRHGMPHREAAASLRRFLNLPVALRGLAELHQDALELTDHFALRAAYDAHYVVLAQKADCSLWTADRRLINALGGRLPFVKWIGDFRPGGPL